jgi:hypothetical protein
MYGAAVKDFIVTAVDAQHLFHMNNMFVNNINMKYRVHRVEVKSDNMQEKLEQFLNKLEGELVSIVPNVTPTLFILGGAAKIDFLLVVERVG